MTYPRYFINVIDGKDRRPHILIYRQDSEIDPLVPHASGVPIERDQIAQLIRDVAAYL